MQCGFQSKATRTPEKVGEEELFVKYPTGWKRVGFAKDPLTVTAQSLMSFGAGDNVSKPWVISGKLSKRVAPDLIFVRRFRRTFRFRLGSNSRLSDSARRSSHVSFLSASRSQRQLSYVSEIGKGKDKIWKSSGVPYSFCHPFVANAMPSIPNSLAHQPLEMDIAPRPPELFFAV